MVKLKTSNMEKINLDMTVEQWIALHTLRGEMTKVAYKVIKNAGWEKLSIWDFCKKEKAELLEIRYLRKKLLTAFCDTLGEAGLRFGMTDGELGIYRNDYIFNKGALSLGDFLSEEEYFNHRVNCEVERRIVEATDWERRKWEISMMLFVRYQHFTNKQANEVADNFIIEYKKSLNTEE